MSYRPLKKQKIVVSAQLLIQFENEEGIVVGPHLNVPSDINKKQLEKLLNGILKNEHHVPYIFKIVNIPLEEVATIGEHVLTNNISVEQSIKIVYRPQALFRVKPITKCNATISGHTESILNVSFSPDGKELASGSGDKTVRLWDLNTFTPKYCCKSHESWVLVVSWSPDGEQLCTGDMLGKIFLWDKKTGMSKGCCRGHKKWIMSIAWEPAHLKYPCERFCTGSKDCTIKIWNIKTRKVVLSFSNQSKLITCVKWGGNSYIYSSSRDTSICIWDSNKGILLNKLMGHAHWVNTLALSSDYVLRTGPYDHHGNKPNDINDAKSVALERYNKIIGDNKRERLISGSDDSTLILWDPEHQHGNNNNNKPKNRMTGHLKLINQVQFSPDGKLIISAGFDKCIKIWDGIKGILITTLSGHVGPVFQICWSPDSRLFVSCSKDTTLKEWNCEKQKLEVELPGHEDEVFAVDWAPNGAFVASGGRDKKLKIWRS